MAQKYLMFHGAMYRLAGGLDEHAVRELLLFMANEEPLVDRKQRMFARLATFVAANKYDPQRALVMFKYLIDDAVRMYGVDADPVAFDTQVRKAVAEDLRNEFESEIRAGAEHIRPMMPAKYRDLPLNL